MSTKLLIRLVPLVGVVAFAVMPAVAQAAPHYYKNSPTTAQYPLAKKKSIIAWGTASFEPTPTPGAVTTCESAAEGYIENPAGGGPGVGMITAVNYFNCSDATECPSGSVIIGSQSYEKEMEAYAPPENLPWPTELESSGSSVTTKITGMVVRTACVAEHLTRLAAPAAEGGSFGAGLDELFVSPGGGNPNVTCEADATHSLKPENANGTNLGNNQARLSYGSGSLNCPDAGTEMAVTGTTKIMLFDNSELVNTHNP